MKPDFDEREAHENGDTLPEQAGVYVPPRDLPALSEHRTMDVKAIRIAAEHDPRQALTQLKMRPPPRRKTSRGLVGSLVLIGGAAALLFVALRPEQQLPLVTRPAPAPAAPGPTTEELTATPPVATETRAPAPVPAPVATEPPAATAPIPPVATSDPTSTARAPKGKAAPARPRRPAAPTAKVSKDPWLE